MDSQQLLRHAIKKTYTSQTNSEHGKGKWSHIPTSGLKAMAMNGCWSGGSRFPIAMKIMTEVNGLNGFKQRRYLKIGREHHGGSERIYKGVE